MSWATAALGEIFEVARGGSPRPIEEYFTDDPEGLNWVLIGDATASGKTITETKKRIRREGLSKTRTVKPGDFILSNSMSFGRPYIMGISGCIHDGWLLLRPKSNNIHPDYFYYLLGSSEVYQRFASRAAGATVKNLNSEIVREVEIAFPPLEVQRRIAAILDQADDLRGKRRDALDRLGSLSNTIFAESLGGSLLKDWRWPSVTVGDAGEVQLGRQRAPQYQTGRYTRPYVRVANVFEERIDTSDVLSMDFDDADFAKYRLEEGDILLNEGQSTELVGRPAMWRSEIPDCCFQNTLVRFKADRARVNERFALAVFVAYFRSGEFSKISSKTSSVAHLGASRLAAMPFPLPPLSVQCAFAARVVEIDKLKAYYRSHLAKLDELFASLQHRAFRGEL